MASLPSIVNKIVAIFYRNSSLREQMALTSGHILSSLLPYHSEAEGEGYLSMGRGGVLHVHYILCTQVVSLFYRSKNYLHRN